LRAEMWGVGIAWSTPFVPVNVTVEGANLFDRNGR
jgi:hypothetical protein